MSKPATKRKSNRELNPGSDFRWRKPLEQSVEEFMEVLNKIDREKRLELFAKAKRKLDQEV